MVLLGLTRPRLSVIPPLRHSAIAVLPSSAILTPMGLVPAIRDATIRGLVNELVAMAWKAPL